MNNSMRKSLGACAILCFCLSLLPASAASISEWRRDLDTMRDNLVQFHPDPFQNVGRIVFLRQLEALKLDLPSLTEEQRVVGAMRLMASLKDRGTELNVTAAAFANWYPVRITEFTDGYFVTSAYKTQADLAGAQVLQIADRPVANVANGARSLLSSENEFSRKERLYALHNSELMRGLGYAAADGSLKIRFKLRTGRTVERTLVPRHSDNPIFDKDDASFDWADLPEVYGLPFGTFDDWIAAFRSMPSTVFRTPDEARPPFMGFRRAFYARAIPQKDAYYAQVNAVSNSRDETYIAFFRRVLKDVDLQKPRRLILDFRYNYGGDGSKATAMIHEFIKREDSPPWKELYILTSGRTGGAAMSVLSAFLENVPVTLIGEPTGVSLNSFADSKAFGFPDIGLKQSVSFLRSQKGESDDMSDSLGVNVPAPFSFADYIAGHDPAVDPILAGAEMRSLPVIALSHGGVAARKVYDARKALRGRFPWWYDPRFIDIKKVGYVLLNAGRGADSVEMFKINAERVPDDWMSWENLGRGQTGAGEIAQARQSYQCAMALDPENFDRGDMMQAIDEGGGSRAIDVATGCPVGRGP